MTIELSLPYAGIVLLIGPSNSGKTTFLEKWINHGILKSSEVVSSISFVY
ncbi:hypothetical protein [Bacillus aquiflavi]|nr:hypothetical protein [Bacillus aquiflavi]